ncbi:MAG: hypothetical protein BAJATHORv1_80063 [Candidatus Thorarchaeota archaeon]|nr:MAG: hypothetical protein BAJATHORv1_80063 [Candidatus Thorarchaeota archaeon]
MIHTKRKTDTLLSWKKMNEIYRVISGFGNLEDTSTFLTEERSMEQWRIFARKRPGR